MNQCVSDAGGLSGGRSGVMNDKSFPQYGPCSETRFKDHSDEGITKTREREVIIQGINYSLFL